MIPNKDPGVRRARHNMAQSATRTHVEPNGNNTNTKQSQTMTITERSQNCESLRNREGKTFTKWWTTQLTLPDRNNAKSGWNQKDFIVLELIQNTYESSTRTESWGCLCNTYTRMEDHNQMTRRSRTGTDDNNATQARSTSRNCAYRVISPNYGGYVHQSAQIQNTCEGETLEMVSDHVAHMLLRASGVYPTQPWYKGQLSPDTKTDVNGNNDTEGRTNLRRDWHLRTSVWIVRAVACITMKLYSSMSAGNAKRTENTERKHKDPSETEESQYSVKTPRAEETKAAPRQGQYNTREDQTSDKFTAKLSRHEIEIVTEKYLRRYRENRENEYSVPQRAQESEKNGSNTPAGGGGQGSKRHSYPVIPPLHNPAINQELTQQNSRVPQPTCKTTSNQANNTGYEGMLKIAKTRHTANIVTTSNTLGDTKARNKLTKEMTRVSKLSNGGSNEESNVNSRQELYRKSSDEIHRGIVTTAETWPDTEITQTGLALDKAEKAARRIAPVYIQREDKEGLQLRAKQTEITEQDRSRDKYRQAVAMTRQRSRDKEKDDGKETGMGSRDRLYKKKVPNKGTKSKELANDGKLRPGEKVVTQNMKSRRWSEEATIIAKNQSGMSYEVEINGKVHTRNRRFLRKSAKLGRLQPPEATGGAGKILNIVTTPPRGNENCQLTVENGHDNKQIPRQYPHYEVTRLNRTNSAHNISMGLTMMANIKPRNFNVKNKPLTVLCDNMTNNQKLVWFEAFETCLENNDLEQENLVEYHIQRRMLFDFISPELAEMLTEKNDDEQTLTGDQGLLATLRTHVLSVNARRYKFQLRDQHRGERCASWWERKTAMASLCELDTVSEQDILVLQLVQGVYDEELKRTLLNKIDDDLDSLIELAHAWSNAKEFWLNGETFSSNIGIDENKNLRKKHTTHKNILPQGKPQNRRQNNDKKPYRETTHPRRSRTRETSSHTQRAIPYTPYRCTGCGGRHNTNDPSDICPATTQTCFICDEGGHYARCCTNIPCAKDGTHQSNFLMIYGIHPQPTEPRRRDITKAIAADESPRMKDASVCVRHVGKYGGFSRCMCCR